ncbi:MAG TPA: TonB family protein [Mucilaginibacter sp.]|nr:TonB family protein [Mucilaginibacter sp.]
MKRLPILILVLISATVFAQTVKRVDKFDKANVRIEYYVLKSDKSIKQGPYAEYSRLGTTPYCEGFYKNNQKDSIWKYYGFNNKLCTTGSYKDGKRIGLWNSYDSDGAQEVLYDYTKKQLLYYKKSPQQLQEQTIINGKDTSKATLERPVIYVDGVGSMFRIIATDMRYPAQARDKNIQGKVLIAFTVDTLGNVSNYRIKSGIGGGCDEESLRIVKLMDGDWLPGMLGGKPVTVEYTIPMTFALETEDQ